MGLYFPPNLEIFQWLLLQYSFYPPDPPLMSLGTSITHICSKLKLSTCSGRDPFSGVFGIFSLLSLALLPSQKGGGPPPVPRLYLHLDSWAHSPIISETSPPMTTFPTSLSRLLPWPKNKPTTQHNKNKTQKVTK